MDKFKNKYRIQSARLQNWDYGSSGMYFITICTKNRKHYFGEIINDEMILNELGLITNAEWLKTPEIRPDMNLSLSEFVIMPNHFHGIIMIGDNQFNRNDIHRHHHGRGAMHGVSTTTDTKDATVETDINAPTNKFGPQTKNLGSIVRGFKSAVTTFARKNNLEFDWQERFHDHIIRNHDEYLRISNYIINNPPNWVAL
jgi:putative transposase